MGSHYNIQVSVQRVDEPEPVLRSGREIGLPGGKVQMTERKVTKVLDLALTAGTEEAAFDRAMTMLDAARPEEIRLMADDRPITESRPPLPSAPGSHGR